MHKGSSAITLLLALISGGFSVSASARPLSDKQHSSSTSVLAVIESWNTADDSRNAGAATFAPPAVEAGVRRPPSSGLLALLAATDNGDDADSSIGASQDARLGSTATSSSISTAGAAEPAVRKTDGPLDHTTDSSNNSSSSSLLDNGNRPPPAALPSLPLQAGTAARVAAIGVPERCIVAGSALFSSCSMEISAAQAHFNITVPFLAPQNYTQLLHERGFTRPQVLQYMQEALAKPSNECCAAQCCFNQLLLCDCEPAVLEVAVRFAGADEAFYALMIAQLALACGIKHYYGPSCPASLSVPRAAATCTSGTVWPPVHSSNLTDPSPSRAVGDNSATGRLNSPLSGGDGTGSVCLASAPEPLVAVPGQVAGGVAGSVRDGG